MSIMAPPQVQFPSTLWVPERLGSYGDEANGFGDAIGIPRDLEQRRDIDCLMSYGPKGRWLTLETAVIEGRQNGKTKAELLTVALADLFLFNKEKDRIVWTAHLMKTTLDTFDRVQELIAANAMLSRRVKSINTSTSEESVELMNGSTMDFIARGPNSGRGLSGKRIVFDEALFLTLSMMGSLMPVLSARDNPQIMYGSSAGKEQSDHLRSIQRRGRRGGDPSLILIEYRAPGSWDDPGCREGVKCTHIYEEAAGCVMDDPANWRWANHAIGAGRMRVEFVAAERRALCQTTDGVLEFGRERMGWEELGMGSLDPDRIPATAWKAATDPASEIDPEAEVCFAIDMNPAQTHVSISVAGKRTDGGTHFGVIAYGRGSEWVPGRLQQLLEQHETLCGVYWIPSAPVRAMTEPLRAAGVPLVDVSPQEYAQACGALKEHLMDAHDLWHAGTEIMDTAFSGAERRVQVEGGWAFTRRKSAGDISPLVAGTLAVLGVDVNASTTPSVYAF